MTKFSSEEIYKILEKELVTLQIKPNEILSENALCARFDVSRTIVRSALQRLSQVGFVEIVPHVGTKVTAIDLEEVNQYIYMRIAIEVKILSDFIRTATPPQIEKLRFRQKSFEDDANEVYASSHFDNSVADELLSKDLSFHRTYYEFMGKEILWYIVSQPKPGYSRFIHLDIIDGKNLPDVLKEHAELMNAIESSSLESIEDILTRHLYGGIRRLGSEIYSDKLSQYIKSN